MLWAAGCVLGLGFDLTVMAPASDGVIFFALYLFFLLIGLKRIRQKVVLVAYIILTSSLRGGVPLNHGVSRTQAVSGVSQWNASIIS